ncbi:glycosyltransferase family 2 protein [Marinococcus luteus]|uniref:glycosyltransferase family 2 protein n=1 Tax=Marinococcus luteus TaxID=1122204 RepID=UPI002ACCD40A|nr:glycosyltransferase family A protein [Marinococcus luteus]MDZ5784211.1 glycosyltransferase family A protein [Marinococcus luteus]
MLLLRRCLCENICNYYDKNRQKELQAAIQSVLNQSRQPAEIIVMDDGSSYDLSQTSDSEFLSSVQYFYHEESLGGAARRNEGAAKATGDVLMFLDDDGTWEPQKIEDQITIFDHHPEVGLVYTGRKVVDAEDRDTVLRSIEPKKRGNGWPDILFNNFIGVTSGVAVRKDLFEQVGGFDTSAVARQDYDLWIRLVRVAEVDYDIGCNVRYTVSKQKGKQISSRKDLHGRAIQYLLNKYSEEIESFSSLEKRRIKSDWYHYVYHRYYLLSFTYYANYYIVSMAEKIYLSYNKRLLLLYE